MFRHPSELTLPEQRLIIQSAKITCTSQAWRAFVKSLADGEVRVTMKSCDVELVDQASVDALREKLKET